MIHCADIKKTVDNEVWKELIKDVNGFNLFTGFYKLTPMICEIVKSSFDYFRLV